MMFSNVDLPDPEGPTTASHSPRRMSSFTSCRATTGGADPNRQLTPSNRTSGSSIDDGSGIVAAACRSRVRADLYEVPALEATLPNRDRDVPVGREAGLDDDELAPSVY